MHIEGQFGHRGPKRFLTGSACLCCLFNMFFSLIFLRVHYRSTIINFPNSYYTGAAKHVIGWESTSPSAKRSHKNSGMERSEPSWPEGNHESPSASQEDTATEFSEPTIPNENPESLSAKRSRKDSEKEAMTTESITTITIIDAPHLQKNSSLNLQNNDKSKQCSRNTAKFPNGYYTCGATWHWYSICDQMRSWIIKIRNTTPQSTFQLPLS